MCFHCFTDLENIHKTKCDFFTERVIFQALMFGGNNSQIIETSSLE